MKEFYNLIDIKDQDGDQIFSGSVVLRIPKRSERTSIQLEAMEITKNGETDPEKYIIFSEKLLDQHLVSIDVKHVPSGEHIGSREDLEYTESEALVSAICSIVIGGKKLGKKTA